MKSYSVLVGLPDLISVRLSSEAAGGIALARVVTQEMKFTELLRTVLSITGKDAARISEILQRGSFVSGGSKLRWESLSVRSAELAEALHQFPDPDVSRLFNRDDCVRVIFRSATTIHADLLREEGLRRRFFRRSTFWGAVMAAATEVEYVTYSYGDGADVFRCALKEAERARLCAAADLLVYSTIARQIRERPWQTLELYTLR